MLGVVGRTAPALQYLNISHSKVTDRGLLDLCGLRAGRGDTGRARLARGCKAGPATHEVRFFFVTYEYRIFDIIQIS